MHQMLGGDDENPRNLEELSEEDIDDLRGSLRTIAGRSEALVKFVQSYRNLTEVIPLTLSNSSFSVRELLERSSDPA